MRNKLLTLLDENKNLEKILLPPMFGFFFICAIFLDIIYLISLRIESYRRRRKENRRFQHDKVAIFFIPIIFVLFLGFLFFISIFFLISGSIYRKKTRVWQAE